MLTTTKNNNSNNNNSNKKGGGAGLDTVAEDLDQLKYDVGELKDLLTNNKGEVNHIRRIVLACERDMEDFTAAMDAVNVDLDEMRARVDATHSIITSRQRVEATMTAEISTMRLDIGDTQEALKNHDSWMEDVSCTLQAMQEKEENLTEDMINLRDEMNAKLASKVDNVAWKEADDDLDAAVKTVSSLRLDWTPPALFLFVVCCCCLGHGLLPAPRRGRPPPQGGRDPGLDEARHHCGGDEPRGVEAQDHE
ncbi:unnamed protein product, partial [Polarella glacialis]